DMGSRRPKRDIAFAQLPPELRYGPPETLEDAMVKDDQIWLRCHARRHVAVIRPETLAQLVGYDCTPTALPRRPQSHMCGARQRSGWPAAAREPFPRRTGARISAFGGRRLIVKVYSTDSIQRLLRRLTPDRRAGLSFLNSFNASRARSTSRHRRSSHGSACS